MRPNFYNHYEEFILSVQYFNICEEKKIILREKSHFLRAFIRNSFSRIFLRFFLFSKLNVVLYT